MRVRFWCNVDGTDHLCCTGPIMELERPEARGVGGGCTVHPCRVYGDPGCVAVSGHRAVSVEKAVALPPCAWLSMG